jgi:multidrug efflux pump subunit AcrA (membrane-fusion protein)
MKRATILMLALLPLAAGCARHAEGDEDGAATPAVVPVRTAAVEERSFADAVEASGQWRSSGDVSLPAPFAAVVESLGPRLGDHVAAGDTLGMLVTRESRAALRGAELLLREAHDAEARTEAERATALAKRDLVRVPIVAPRTGVVTRRDVEPGAEVNDGAEVLAITPTEGIVFEARLPAAATQLVHAGMAAVVRTVGEPDREVRVARVLPAASASDQATLVWLKPLGGATPLLDRFGTLAMKTSGTRRSPAVPAAAVVENDLDGSARVVVVGADSIAVWTPVTLGASAEGWRELTGAAPQPGARVVVEGVRGLPDHAHVKPQP